jgi:hypothetical protein
VSAYRSTTWQYPEPVSQRSSINQLQNVIPEIRGSGWFNTRGELRVSPLPTFFVSSGSDAIDVQIIPRALAIVGTDIASAREICGRPAKNPPIASELYGASDAAMSIVSSTIALTGLNASSNPMPTF